MRRSILFLLALTFSFSTMAQVITCSGQTTKASIVLKLTGKVFPLEQADYSFDNKLIPTSGYTFGIDSSLKEQTQKLTYKFKTLKGHSLAKKNSNLILTIRQNSTENDPLKFNLNKSHQAELKTESEGVVILLDRMDCK